MNFQKSLDLKEVYDSDEDDILNNFYIPAISNAARYDRLAGYFSSTILAISAKGMADFIRNNGKMRLVTCLQITKADRRAIEDGLTRPEEAISRIITTELDLADQIEKDHVAALAWMIARKNLEIKIAVPYAEGEGYHTEALDKNSMYHQKIGVLYDDCNNIVSFSGSVNETSKAWTGNIEEFKVFCNWKPGQDRYGASDATKFEKFWYGSAKNTKIFDLPTAVRERLLSDAPKSVEDAVCRIQKGAVAQPNLRDYQQNAVDRWLKNDRRGIFKMATGTGKTLTAISCIKKVLESDSSYRHLVVISCPYIHLIMQWEKELRKWNIEPKSAYGSSKTWMTELHNSITWLNDGILEKLVIITTNDTFSSEKFTDMIKKCSSDMFVIADEVHGLGAEHSQKGLIEEYKYRLGLSATPERYFDDAGTERIFGFFGGVVFAFELDEAIKHGYLTRYLLFPHIVYMTDDEANEYHKFTMRIAIEESKDMPDQELLKTLSIKRSNIVKMAKNKIVEFRKFLHENHGLDHCLVYCAKELQLDEVSDVLHENGSIFHRFTFKESNRERKKLLREFEHGDKDVLLAIKCLDQGVDIPSTKTAVILASSHNPIEFIQRRGRILRPHDNKDRATIHDMIVLPRVVPEGQLCTESEKSIIRKELERLREFAASSDNPDYSMKIISTLMCRYDL